MVISDVTIFVAAMIAIIVVIMIRRRTEAFIVLTLFCYWFMGLISIGHDVARHYYSDIPKSFGLVIAFSTFLYMMAHWFFSSQYLRTSKTFPRLLTQAKLEFAAKADSPASRMTGRSSGFNTNRMTTELEKSGHKSGTNAIEILAATDSAIAKEKK